MLNIIWPMFIIISYVYAILNGNVDKINESVFESATSAVQLSITFLGTICLWNGIMKIAQTTTLVEKLTKLLKPIIRFLFPELKNNKKAKEEISMNMIANMLGLGNAATPLGIKAMQTMQQENPKKEELSNSMAMFIIINTASMQIIPTTIIAIRASLNAKNPTAIIVPIWIATAGAAITGIILTKLAIAKSNKKELKKWK